MQAPTPASIEQLKYQWLACKAAERKANADRLLIEAQIVALMPAKTEGSVTDNGVTVTYSVNRKADTAALQDQWTALPPNVQNAFRWKAEVNATQIKALAELDEDAYRIAADFVTSTPAKPAIEIKPAKE